MLLNRQKKQNKQKTKQTPKKKNTFVKQKNKKLFSKLNALSNQTFMQYKFSCGY